MDYNILNAESVILDTLSADSFVMVNKKLMRKFDGNGTTACFLSELISAYKWHKESNSLEADGSFAIPINRYKTLLGMSHVKQSNALKALSAIGFVRTRLQGFPAVKYVALNWASIADALAKDDLAIKQQQQIEFYSNLNTVMANATSEIEDLEEACGNMQTVLKGVVLILSQVAICRGYSVQWTSTLVGKIRSQLRNVSTDLFDFSAVKRATSEIDVVKDFEAFITEYLKESKKVLPVHHSKQIYDYRKAWTG